ncbi:chromosome segregation protein SMC [Kingella kingae]|uniref:chromosome segregation protein SMC n=1 Tax=Kingella kingae TaxID=504 RepID=UPI002554D4BB|nr:chromosome segregation protein SMC [Kingella kingae]MDK4554710.1 chromosome segregation protein SMC [Kingella kingae]MDK4657659.1 chromosome segregation protein SMC [Kingella kingae]
MRLTQIKLAGFKSFTDPTTIHVPGQLVAVIGPNGCGKSNVIDAVRWVLGEASAKQLRGESMQDVIFNGAATRRPAPRASVELVFDNSDHSLQGAWGQYAEVSIKRQLTRQGDSSYFINNQAVRRRDITDLFLGTGVGARGYAVIEQGMISRIIEARPEELRAYIEEAAGVSKYKERRRETETRLKDTREHLQRLADLQTELARQVEKLEKQAGTAENYQQLQEKLTRLQNILDFVQWQTALADADKLSEAHYAAKYQQEQAQEQNIELNEKLNALRQTEQEQQQHHHALNQEHALLREQIARLEEQLRARQSQQQRMERDKAAAQVQLHKIQQEQIIIRSECDILEGDIADKQVALSELAMAVAEHETRLPELEQSQQETQFAYQNQQDEFNRIKRELALKQQQLQHTSSTLSNNTARLARLNDEQAALNLPPDTELLAAQEQAELLQNQYDESEMRLAESENNLNQAKTRFQAAETQFNQLFQQYLTAQAQFRALAELLQNQPTHDFWGQTHFADAPVLWQHLVAPAAWQHALSVVLAQRLQSRLLPENNDLANDLPQGSAAWISHSGSLHKKTQPAQALINQIQITHKDFQAAVAFWLDGVLCAPNLAYAVSQQGELQNHQIWLTPEGHIVDKFGVVLFEPSSSLQLIEHKSRHDDLVNELAELAPKLAAAQTLLDQCYEENQSLEHHYRDVQAQNRQLAAQVQKAQSKANELFARTNQGQLRREHIARELQQIAEDNRQLAQNRDSLHDDIETLAVSAHELELQHQTLSGSHQQQQTLLKQAQLALLEANRQYGLAEIALHKQQQRLDNLRQQIRTLEQQKLDWQERQTELALQDEADEDPDNSQPIQLNTLSEHDFALQDQMKAAQNHLAETQALGRELYAQQQTLSAQLPQFQAAAQNTLLQQQEALLNAKRYHENLHERGADLAELETAAKNAPSSHHLSQDIAKTSQTIQSLGAVNLAALQELEEARERDEYYRSQSSDVQAAIDLLEEAIAQIDSETKTRFKETFDAVNEKVQTFFPTLFGGGEASLKMSDDDLLTAGVSIMARPPGKKNSTIHLLSGGEKALTAMSLVFALFSLNPAPFCLLDEVDAPLDDANTSRFCNLVKEMSAQTQFLYISHNRLTMEMAEQLIGVTMQEKGVSRIVAVDIQQALQMAEQ